MSADACGTACGSDARAGSTRTGGESCTPPASRSAGGSALRVAVRHRRAQHHLLPAAADADGRDVGRGRRPPGFVYAVKLGAVRLAPHEAARRGIVAAEPPRPASSASATRSGRSSCSCRRAGSATSSGSTSSSPSRRRRCAGRSSCATPSWLHDDVFEVLERHGAALCIHDLLADHPWVLTTDWTYVRFHGPNALEQPYHGAYRASGLARGPNGSPPLLDDGRRRVRLLQQRLRGPRRRRRRMPSACVECVGPPASVITQKATSSGACRT